jgi:hypothetical protein
MSSGAPLLHGLQDQQVLGELLHSLSQPLTSLRCSLEVSIDEVTGSQQEAVAAALEQAERVVGMVRLLREYLDAEEVAATAPPIPWDPVLRSVVAELESVAEVRQIRIGLTGASVASIHLSEASLRLALQYLIGVQIEQLAPNRQVTLGLEDGPTEAVLYGQLDGRIGPGEMATANTGSGRDPVMATMQRVKMAIARKILEPAGASLLFDGGSQTRFVLRVPTGVLPTLPQRIS